jgi:hypothetical protein
VISPAGGLVFSGACNHPVLGRREVYSDPEPGRVRRVDGPSEGSCAIKIPNVPGASTLRVYDVPELVDLDTDEGRASRSLIGELAIPAAGRSLVGPLTVQPNPDGSLFTGLLVQQTGAIAYDVVVMGDGFTAAEQDLFNLRAREVVETLETREPYASHLCALNVWRVNVVSTESGIDRPEEGISKDTALDCRYGNPSADRHDPLRLITCESPDKCRQAAAHAPDSDTILVLVNDTLFGGGGNSEIVTTAIYSNFANTLTHELGHNIGGLDDEYPCLLCDGTDDDRLWTGVAFDSPNLTTSSDRNLVPWSALIAASTPVPTTVDDPPGVVGIWEGGYYYAKGIYRSQFLCHMRDTDAEFCAACSRALTRRLDFRCPPCFGSELPATRAFVCLDLGRLKRIAQWTSPFVLRFPIPPPCSSCPDMRFEDLIRYRLDGLPAEGFELRIRDLDGTILGEAERMGEGSLEVSFPARRTTQLFGELITPEPSQGTLTLQATLFRNGVREEQP